MLARLIEWVQRLFGVRPRKAAEPVDTFVQRYEDATGENITAVIAGRLSSLTLGESTLAVEGNGQRAELLTGVANALWRKMPGIVAQAWGKGGKVLVPMVTGGEIVVTAVDQSRVAVSARQGERITAATVLADQAQVNSRRYYRLMDYRLDGDLQVIRQRVVSESGMPVPMDTVAQWAGIDEEISISGTDRLLLAWIRCPRDNRSQDSDYGVPVTWGAETEISELCEHLKWYRREFKLARPMLGLDATLWRNMDDLSIQDVRRTVQDDETPFVPVSYGAIGEGQQWQHFAPAIRQSEFEGRLNSLYRRVEKACGLSQGILTERQQMNYANRDEVRAAMYDTYSLVSLMRREIESAVRNVLYAADVLAERFGLTPAGARGQWEAAFDWDMSLLESSQQTFAQMSELQSRGLITGERLTQWVLGGTMEDARAEVEQAKAQQPDPMAFGETVS